MRTRATARLKRDSLTQLHSLRSADICFSEEERRRAGLKTEETRAQGGFDSNRKGTQIELTHLLPRSRHFIHDDGDCDYHHHAGWSKGFMIKIETIAFFVEEKTPPYTRACLHFIYYSLIVEEEEEPLVRIPTYSLSGSIYFLLEAFIRAIMFPPSLQ